jgi:hypothetical protein
MTMRKVEYRFCRRWPHGHFNPHHNVVVTFDRTEWELEHGGGNSDDVCVYRTTGGLFYVLNINRGLPYAGLALYDVATFGKEAPRPDVRGEYTALSPVSEVFLQVDHEIEHVLGKRGVDQRPVRLIRLLADSLQV